MLCSTVRLGPKGHTTMVPPSPLAKGCTHVTAAQFQVFFVPNSGLRKSGRNEVCAIFLRRRRHQALCPGGSLRCTLLQNLSSMEWTAKTVHRVAACGGACTANTRHKDRSKITGTSTTPFPEIWKPTQEIKKKTL